MRGKKNTNARFLPTTEFNAKKGLMANKKMFISQIALNPPAMMVGCVNETNLVKMPEFSIFRLLV